MTQELDLFLFHFRQAQSQPFQSLAKQFQIARTCNFNRLIKLPITQGTDGLIDLTNRPGDDNHESHHDHDQRRYQCQPKPEETGARLLSHLVHDLHFAVNHVMTARQHLPRLFRHPEKQCHGLLALVAVVGAVLQRVIDPILGIGK